ncbi:MAG: hypothetical protein ACRD44_12110 [Bryobacteraceae bacterium]
MSPQRRAYERFSPAPGAHPTFTTSLSSDPAAPETLPAIYDACANFRVRKIGNDDRLTTVAGNGMRGSLEVCRASGQAVSAAIGLALDVIVDPTGNLYPQRRLGLRAEGLPGWRDLPFRR